MEWQLTECLLFVGIDLHSLLDSQTLEGEFPDDDGSPDASVTVIEKLKVHMVSSLVRGT